MVPKDKEEEMDHQPLEMDAVKLGNCYIMSIFMGCDS